MANEHKARKLLSYLSTLSSFEATSEPDYGNYGHMGATITASILQAGLNWQFTVQPRVEHLRNTYPEAATTSGFLELAHKRELATLLRWQDREKPARILMLAKFLQSERLETEQQLREWFLRPENGTRLLKLRGVGNKTVDFLKILVRIQTNAVDRHLAGILAEAGVEAKGYDEIHEVINLAADLQGIERLVFDFGIWRYMSEKSKRRRTRR
jgi:endonuclease III